MLTKRGFMLGALALGGCSAAPAIPTTGAQLSITGAADMNGGAPAQVKVFYLRDTRAFASSDFFGLFETPEDTLGEDLVKVSTFQLAPGRTITDAQSFALVPGAPVPAAIGVVAAFRDISGRFQASTTLQPGVLSPVQVTLAGSSVTIL